MLVAFAAAALLSGSTAVACTVFFLVVPFNVLVGVHHRQTGEAGWRLAADQYLAGSCAVIDPKIALGVVVCQLVGAVTAGMGVRQRVVQPSIVAGGALLVVAGLIHGDRPLLAFCLPVTLSAMRIARVVAHLKNRNLAANRRYEELLDGINAFVFESDLKSGKMLYMNRRTRQIVGSAARADRSLLDLVHLDDRRLAIDSARRARATGEPVTTEVRVFWGGEMSYVEMRTTVSAKGSRRRVRTVLIDVSDRKFAELELAHRAVHDPLTDLPNRALLGERLSSALDDDSRATGAVLMLDLNNFKRVNDALGHASGDLLLVEVADRLRLIARPTDTVARLGGDEFAVLMPSADRGDALAFADRCAAALSQPWSDRGVTITPKVSIGVALAQGDGAAGETLLRRADTAMYECKRTGGDRVVYDVTLECLNVERLRLLTDDADTGALRNRIGDRLGSAVRSGELVEEPE
jgi:diguanylate cyclase (GGDEF)-like protein/PAS domain S-box-containing protein